MKIKDFLDDINYRFRTRWQVEPEFMNEIWEERDKEVEEYYPKKEEIEKEEKEFQW